MPSVINDSFKWIYFIQLNFSTVIETSIVYVYVN